jgi:hypothetical protein
MQMTELSHVMFNVVIPIIDGTCPDHTVFRFFQQTARAVSFPIYASAITDPPGYTTTGQQRFIG